MSVHGATHAQITSPSAVENSSGELIDELYAEIGRAIGVDPGAEQIPISDAVDPEALSRVFNDDRGETFVSFTIDGYRVTVFSDGEVVIAALPEH